MAPKKAKDKEAAKLQQQQPEAQSLYKRREPLSPQEPPDVTEAEAAWKAGRNAFSMPLPEWDTEAVNTTEWKPNETEALYRNDSFSPVVLPEDFQQTISTWKRAVHAMDPAAPEEPPPSAQPLPEAEVAPPNPPEPKAKAKAEPKAKAKAGKVEEPAVATTRTTVQQFAECSYSGEACVVSTQEFRTRELYLHHDEAAPEITQVIGAQFAVIAEHRGLIPRGYYLWELIYPQGEDGVPLYNPHGKYIVRLYVHGRWRQVLVDDLMPVGTSAIGGTFATVLPASSLPGVIWPQLLAKALLRAHQGELSSPMLPAITALTGWLPYRLPMTWESLQRSFCTRSFLCMRLQSQLDLEVPGMPMNAPAMPRLVGQGTEAPCEFLVCELEEEPRQVRLKAATWRPMHGLLRKTILNAESELEDEDEEGAEKLPEEMEESEHEEQDNEEDDEDRATQQSPSGGEQTALQSARSKEEGAGGTNEDGGGTEAAHTDVFDDPVTVPWVNPWPETLPPQMMMKSVLKDYHRDLRGGFWVAFNHLEAAGFYVSYMPPGTILKAVHDTTWGDDRRQPYVSQANQLLKLRLMPEGEKRRKMSSADTSDPPKSWGPPWHRAVFIYEPLRLDSTFGTNKELPPGPGTSTLGCLLQSVNCWQAVPPTAGMPPEGLHLSVGDTNGGNGSNNQTSVQGVLLPQGEHWYLVQDDAMRAGSSLSVYVEGTLLNLAQSSIEFVDPAKSLKDQGAFVAVLEPTHYPAQQGFAIWAKVELMLRQDVVADAPRLQLLSHVADPSLWPYLQLTFLRLSERESTTTSESRCAGWSVTRVMRSPLLQLMSLPLSMVSAATTADQMGSVIGGSAESSFGDTQTSLGVKPSLQGDVTGPAKYVLMLEACTPFPVKAGDFRLQLLLPPRTEGWSVPPSARGPEHGSEEGGEAPPGALDPFRLRTLKADHTLRWSAEIAPNPERLVLCERLTAPMGAGTVTAMLRVTTSGLPKAFIRASLMAQLPPKEEMRPRNENGEAPEALQYGAPIDPREYGGRRNWLASCRTIVEESGVEVAVFPHVIFCEGLTYLLNVYLDPFKGPDKLEGGTWLLEIFGSGEVEAGADTMEQDLEELVRRSWDETAQDPSRPARAERAAASRRKWLIDHGLEPPPEKLSEEAEADVVDASPKGKKPGKAENPKTKAGAAPPVAATPEEPAEDPVRKAAREREEYEAVLKRVEERPHANTRVADFVHLHSKVPAVLNVEDPYTIAPDPPLGSEVEEAFVGEDDAEVLARKALGMLGMQEFQRAEVEASIARWEVSFAQMDEAKERNRALLEELTQWREEHATMKMPFLEAREMLCKKLQKRLDKQSVLKDLVLVHEAVEGPQLQQAIQEAEQSEVATWDKDLMDLAGVKLHFLEGFTSLKGTLEKPVEEALAEPSAKEELAKALSGVKDAHQQLRNRKVALPTDLNEDEVFAQIERLTKAPAEEPA